MTQMCVNARNTEPTATIIIDPVVQSADHLSRRRVNSRRVIAAQCRRMGALAMGECTAGHDTRGRRAGIRKSDGVQIWRRSACRTSPLEFAHVHLDAASLRAGIAASAVFSARIEKRPGQESNLRPAI